MPSEYLLSRVLAFGVMLLVFWSIQPCISVAQSRQGLGPGGTRLTKPDAPSRGTGFGPNTGFGPSSGSSRSSEPPGTRCVSIQCADGTVVPCNSSCPRPPSPPARSGAGADGTQSYRPPGAPDTTDTWRAEEQRRRQEQEARQAEVEQRRRAEFAKSREEALGALKGLSSSGVTLKGAEPGSGLELKGFDTAAVRDAPSRTKPASADPCQAGTDPSVVNLCRLDLTKPIVVDIATATGKRRFQISLKTRENRSYMKGFDAILVKNYAVAVQHFRDAQRQLGNDLLVQNGLALAQDLLRVQRQKAQLDDARRAFNEGMNLGIRRDYANAIRQLKSAVALDPTNVKYRDELSFVQGVGAGAALERDRAATAEKQALAEKAFQVAETSVVPIALSDWTSVVAILRVALVVNPDDPRIVKMLDVALDGQKQQQIRANEQAATRKSKP